MLRKMIAVSILSVVTIFIPVSGESFAQGQTQVELVESWNLNLGVTSIDDHLGMRQSVRWVVNELEQKEAEQLTSLMRVISKRIPADPGEILLKEGIQITTLEIPARGAVPLARAVLMLKYSGKEPQTLSLVTSTSLPRRIPGQEAGSLNAMFEKRLVISIDSKTLELAECIWRADDGNYTFPSTASATTKRTWVSVSGTLDERSGRLLRKTKRLWGSGGEYPLPLAKIKNITSKWPKELDDHALTVMLPEDVDPLTPYGLRFAYTVKQAELKPEAVWKLFGGEESVSFTLQGTARLGTAANDDGVMVGVHLPMIMHFSWFKKRKAIKDSSK